MPNIYNAWKWNLSDSIQHYNMRKHYPIHCPEHKHLKTIPNQPLWQTIFTQVRLVGFPLKVQDPDLPALFSFASPGEEQDTRQSWWFDLRPLILCLPAYHFRPHSQELNIVWTCLNTIFSVPRCRILSCVKNELQHVLFIHEILSHQRESASKCFQHKLIKILNFFQLDMSNHVKSFSIAAPQQVNARYSHLKVCQLVLDYRAVTAGTLIAPCHH